MYVGVVFFCAIAAIFVVGVWVYNEFRDLWAHPDHRASGGGSQYPKAKSR